MEEARKKGEPWCFLRNRAVKMVLCGKREKCLLHKACFFCLRRGLLHKAHEFEKTCGEWVLKCPKEYSWKDWYETFETERRALVAREFKQ